MVLGFHSTFATGFPDSLKSPFRWIFDGDLGVRFFFVISGFLITWLMLQEKDRTGEINLQNFYARRCLRIFPVYFTFLAVLAGLQFLGVFNQSKMSWIGDLTFSRNLFGQDPISEHLWSLSVEEQFYLVWPGVFLFLGGGRNFRIAAAVSLLSILVSPAFRGLSGRLFTIFPDCPKAIMPLFSGNSFFLRFDSLAFGCAAAILLFHKREIVQKTLSGSWLITTAAILLIIVPEIFFRPILTILVFQTRSSLQALGISILLLQSVIAPHQSFYRALNWNWVRQVGVLSYSIYIWQQLFWSAPKGLNHIWWMGVWIIPLFLTAFVSYYGLERPLLKLRERYRKMKLDEK